jgi:hypothetical protein
MSIAKRLRQGEVFKGKRGEIYISYLDTKFISLGDLKQELVSAH